MDQRVRALIGWGLPLVVAMVHVALIAPHYFVGSFDDDGSYIMAAKALAAGEGLTGHVPSGASIVSLYPPGYSALLAPLVWLWPHTFDPLRIFSAVCVAALFPLLWVYLGRKGIRARIRSAILLLLALTPVLATYGSMVMAEAPYLVLLMVLLLLVDHWDSQARVWTVSGLGVVIASAGLVWLKLAGVGAVLGLVLYLVVHRDGRGRIRRAVLVAAGVALSLVPVLLARIATNTPLLGARYAQNLGGYYAGGILSRAIEVLPTSGIRLLGTAIPNTIAPYGSPLPSNPFLSKVVWQVFAVQLVVVMAFGTLWWWRRYRDAVVAIVLIYLLETVFYPQVNERRVILVIPILVAWYVLGGVATIRFVHQRRARSAGGAARESRRIAFAAGGVVVLILAVLVPQMPRDYLFGLGQDSSHFGGSRYVRLLSHLGKPSQLIETDYRSTTALFTGHRTGWSAFGHSGDQDCSVAGISADHAAYLLLGDVNRPGVLDNRCLLKAASTSTWAVELLHTRRDNATVFELIGPGTGNPGLRDLIRSATETMDHVGERTTWEWNWSTPEHLDQVSVGEAALTSGRTTGAELEALAPRRGWTVIAASRSAVGDGAGDAPYLLATNLSGMQASAVRVVLTGTSAEATADIEDVAALGR